MMLGQVIASVGSPLTLNIMTKVRMPPRLISHTWDVTETKHNTLHSACLYVHVLILMMILTVCSGVVSGKSTSYSGHVCR